VAEDAGAEHVEQWLRKSGLPLEARTLAALRAVHADAEHARHYVDPTTGKVREVDIVARLYGRGSGTPNRAAVVLTAVVECKSSPGVSWVALVDVETRRDFTSDDALLPAVQVIERRGASRGNLTRIWDAPVLRADDPLAYQLIDTGSRSETWDALQQVLGAVDGVARDVPDDTGRPALVVLLPVLVTASPLYTCRVTDDGVLDVKPIDHVPVVARLRVDDERQAVWVVQERALARFAKVLRDSADRLRPA
jgi:hypothetical protein